MKKNNNPLSQKNSNENKTITFFLSEIEKIQESIESWNPIIMAQELLIECNRNRQKWHEIDINELEMTLKLYEPDISKGRGFSLKELSTCDVPQMDLLEIYKSSVQIRLN
ncbi:MAG: hypothetical protein Q8928_02560 [Bacteroidota bacterium]|nr:hypothetical protein [Bacteroidota bacterium]